MGLDHDVTYEQVRKKPPTFTILIELTLKNNLCTCHQKQKTEWPKGCLQCVPIQLQQTHLSYENLHASESWRRK